MSVVSVLIEAKLNLNDMNVIYKLSSLETELNQLHNLGLVQGLFFKTIFLEVVSDIERCNLKEPVAHHSPNASHMSRSYWKTTIFVRDIMNIRKKWKASYSTQVHVTIDPIPQNTRNEPETSLTLLDKTLMSLCVSIEMLCLKLEDNPLSQETSRPATTAQAHDAGVFI